MSLDETGETTNVQNANKSSTSGMNPREENSPDPNFFQPTGFDRGIDNPLRSKQGVPVTQDDLRDSTDRIINASTTNIVRDPDNKNVWDVAPDDFYNEVDQNDPNKRFDLKKFNKVFDINREISKRNQRVKDLEKLNELSRVDTITSLYDLNISQILVNIKNTWFNLLDDLLEQRFQLDTFTKENRLFYIGLTILFIASVMYIYTIIVGEEDQYNYDYGSGYTPGMQPIYIFQGKPNQK